MFLLLLFSQPGQQEGGGGMMAAAPQQRTGDVAAWFWHCVVCSSYPEAHTYITQYQHTCLSQALSKWYWTLQGGTWLEAAT